MSTASEGSLPQPSDGVRATDAGRTRAIARLREAVGEGAIDLEELEHRIAAAYEARTQLELDRVTADLPAPARDVPARGSSALDIPAFRIHLTAYALVIGLLFLIWLAGGAGLPIWPVFPAAGWGVGLGLHWQVSEVAARRRSSRRPPAAVPHGREAPALASAGDQRSPTTRFVVAMFVDVAGSTQLNEALGDEQWAVVRHSFRDLVDEVVRQHGGWEVSCSGDGVLVRFEHPSAAADAAVTILRRLERRRESGFAPPVRIGIHSGDAVDEGHDIIGNVVNLAARVTEVAERDEVVVTEHVADHLDGRHPTTGRGLHTLKGVGRPRHLLALDWR